MIDELAQLPTTLFGWLMMATGVVFLALSLIRRSRTDTVETLKTSNETLRGLVDDQEKKIREIQQKVDELCLEVNELKNKNMNMESLIVKALTEYFSAHPNEASRIQHT